MMNIFSCLLLTAVPLVIEARDLSIGTLITELLICALLIVLLFLFKQRFLKIICACGAEVCLWLACKMAFGSDAIITQIFTWITALVTIIVVIAIVNRIDWSNLRGKNH